MLDSLKLSLASLFRPVASITMVSSGSAGSATRCTGNIHTASPPLAICRSHEHLYNVGLLKHQYSTANSEMYLNALGGLNTTTNSSSVLVVSTSESESDFLLNSRIPVDLSASELKWAS